MALDKATIGTRYATALFQLAQEQQQLETVYADVVALQQVLTATPTLTQVLADPTLAQAQKTALLTTLKQQAVPLIQNLIQMVFDYGRTTELPIILADFVKLYDHSKGIAHATVTTAVPLADDQKQKLADQFAVRIGAQQLTLAEKVDPAIIGGVIMQADDLIVDGSVRRGLATVKQLLLKK
jgi:F-type H+-transporting ATPase subunit delta